jgi:hypothetical protein
MTEINQVSRQRPLSVVFPAKAGIQELSRKVRAPEWIPAFAGKTGEGRTNNNWCTGMLLKDTICSVHSNTSCPPSLNGSLNAREGGATPVVAVTIVPPHGSG